MFFYVFFLLPVYLIYCQGILNKQAFYELLINELKQ